MPGMKIGFIGGGSVQWALKLVTDIALNEALAGADLVLHDIDVEALELLTRACRRVVEQAHGSLHVTATSNRVEALRDARRDPISASRKPINVDFASVAAAKSDRATPSCGT